MDIMLGTSVRIGECLGLRRCDVDMTTQPPTLVVNGTIVCTKAQGTHRKDSPKRSRQRRSIALPSMAAAAVRRRLALAEPDPQAFLFSTRTGRSLSVSNYERLLRAFVHDERTALASLDIDVDEYTTHLYRRMAATLIERAAGITLASRLLGHASEQVTRWLGGSQSTAPSHSASLNSSRGSTLTTISWGDGKASSRTVAKAS